METSNSVIKIERQQVTQDETTNEVIGNYVIRVPRKELVQNYIERKIHNVKENTIYDLAKANGFNILIEGHAGVGKTSSAMNYAYQNGQGCYVASCSVGLEVGHLVGKTIIKNNGEAGWVDGVLTQAMKNGDVFVLDEIDFGTPKILQRLQDVLQNRTLSLMENGGEVVTAHPNFMLIATYNNGYRHSNKLNEALLDRFKIKLYFDYDETIEKQLIKSPTLLKLANQMRADSLQGLYSTPVSLRILTTVEKLAKELNYDFAIENFLMNFNDDERPSVKLLLEAHRTHLEPELTNN